MQDIGQRTTVYASPRLHEFTINASRTFLSLILKNNAMLEFGWIDGRVEDPVIFLNTRSRVKGQDFRVEILRTGETIGFVVLDDNAVAIFKGDFQRFKTHRFIGT